MMNLTPQHIANAKVNNDIRFAAQDYKRQPNVQPIYANLNGTLARQGSWE